MDTTSIDNFSILILEESSTVQDLFADWISEVRTNVISSPEEIPKRFDSTVIVACLSQTALGDETDTVMKYIFSRNPYCQVIGVLPRGSFVSPYEGQFDDILERPVFKEEFRETIEFRYIAGAYSNFLSELYDVNSSLLAIQRAGDDEIENKQESIAKIKSRQEDLNIHLQSLGDHLPGEAILDILPAIERHDQYLTKPEADPDSGKSTKFRARRCPACKLPWGVDHRNHLGNGFNRLGADVYQCTRCNKIMHGLAGEQRVF